MRLVRREGDEDRNAVANAVCVRVEAHDPPSLLRARQVARRVLDVSQEALRRGAQTGHVSDLGHVASDRSCPAVRVLVLPGESLTNLYGAFLQVLRRKAFPFARLHGLERIHGTTQVHRGTKQIVPRHEAKEPISAHLCFDAPGHDADPQRRLHAWSVRFATIPLLLGELWHVGHTRAEAEDVREGHAKVPRLELVDHGVARHHGKALQARSFGGIRRIVAAVVGLARRFGAFGAVSL